MRCDFIKPVYVGRVEVWSERGNIPHKEFCCSFRVYRDVTEQIDDNGQKSDVVVDKGRAHFRLCAKKPEAVKREVTSSRL